MDKFLFINYRVHPKIFHLITEYDFERRNNTDCAPRGEEFSSADEAEKACKSEKLCQGVLYVPSSSSNAHYLCQKNATTVSGDDIKNYTLYGRY